MLTEPKLPASSRVGSNQWLVGEFKGPVLCIQGGPLCGGIYDPLLQIWQAVEPWLLKQLSSVPPALFSCSVHLRCQILVCSSASRELDIRQVTL